MKSYAPQKIGIFPSVIRRGVFLQTILLVFLLLVLCACQAPPPFEFAWLSDTHIGTSGAAENLELLINDINQQKNIDFTIISGDITELDTDDYMLQAKRLFDELGQPYYIIPGNHDTKWTASGGKNFIDLFCDDKFTFLYQKFRFIGLHQGPMLRMGDGHFAPQDLVWLDSLLTADKNQRELFFVTHYPVDESVSNWFEFINIIKDHNVKFLMHGHGHSNRIETFCGLPAAMGRSSLARKQQAGYNIVKLSDNRLTVSEKNPGIPLQPPWLTLSLAKEVKVVLPDSVPDYSVNKSYQRVRAIWRVFTGYTLTSSAAVYRNSIFVGDASGRLYAFDLETGTKKWQFQSGAAIYGSAAVHKDVIVFTSVDSSIYCLDRRTGSLNWQVKTAAPVVASVAIDSVSAYVGASDGAFRCIDLKSGSVRWRNNDISGFVETRPLLYKDKVIFAAWDGKLYALNRKTGNTAWTWSGGRPGLLYSPAACWPVASNDKVFIAAPDRYLSAIDAGNGKTIWRSNRYQVRESIGMAADGSILYARCMRDTVIAFDPAFLRLKTQWVADCGYGYDIAPSMPQEKMGTLYFGTKEGVVIALNAKSGEIKWKYRVGPNLVNTVCPLDDHSVIVTTIHGQVVVLSEETNSK